MKAHLHSISDIITNSSTEMFTILKRNAISIAKRQLQDLLDVTQCGKEVDDLFDVQATIKVWGESDMETLVCTNDKELNKALDRCTETAPEECELTVKAKDSGMVLSILQRDNISESREFCC